MKKTQIDRIFYYAGLVDIILFLSVIIPAFFIDIAICVFLCLCLMSISLGLLFLQKSYDGYKKGMEKLDKIEAELERARETEGIINMHPKLVEYFKNRRPGKDFDASALPAEIFGDADEATIEYRNKLGEHGSVRAVMGHGLSREEILEILDGEKEDNKHNKKDEE